MKLTTAQDLLNADPRLRIDVIASTPNPQQTCWLSLHQCYSEGAAIDDPLSRTQSEEWYGERVINKCLKFGHWSVTEGATISINVVGFPHDVMQQVTRHRFVSPSVQSGRYTSKRFLDEDLDIEDVYWLRPEGFYRDRDNTPIYEYTRYLRDYDKRFLSMSREHYVHNISTYGYAPEHARQMAPFGFRQNFVLSGNLRAMLHLLMLRGKADVQLETQAFAILLREQLAGWCPEILEWWEAKGNKLKLTP